MTQNVIPPQATDTLNDAIARLRQCSQQDVQSQWRVWLMPEAGNDLDPAIATRLETWDTWAIATLNERQHIAWPKGRRTLWLGQRITVPTHLHQYPLEGLSLRLAIAWWAETSIIYVNGQPVQEGDLFDCSTRIFLGERVNPGDVFDVAVRLESPGHDPGALVRSLCVYETDYPAVPDPEPGFVADEIAVVQRFLAHDSNAIAQVADIIQHIQWDALPDRTPFNRSLAQVRQQLATLGEPIKQRQIWSTGHAHLDMAWLWPVAETWRAAERTFQSALNLQNDFPELIFCHSTPALYAWMEEHRPDLFTAIQARVAEGRWEIAAGLWIEPELNLISGESIVRQVLYGQRYVEEKFGQRSAIAWLPDTFGFCWQLPQILTDGGITYFVTQKLRWNDTTQFPYDLFWWRSPDGSQILAYNSPLIGESIHPIRMADYAKEWETKTGHAIALWLPGVGDHGGGPTRDMLETHRRWQESPLFPKVQFSTVEHFLDTVTQAEQSRGTLPVWNDELYLELHRGCYTTHADQKWYNRRCEAALYQAELFSSLATLVAGTPYPHTELEHAWKQVLFNQFHDILPGSSIPQVFIDANAEWENALQTVEKFIAQGLGAIALQIACGSPPRPAAQPILIFNPLNWVRSEVVAIPLPEETPVLGSWCVYDANGNMLPSQVSAIAPDSPCLLFVANEIPSVGYATFWLASGQNDPVPEGEPPAAWVLENEYLYGQINPDTGEIDQIFDKCNQREVLSAPGNQLQAFQDSGQYWDAWNIAPDYADHPLLPPILEAIAWIEFGAVRQRLRVTHRFGQSTFQQDYVLDSGSPLLKIETIADWQETHVILKAAFPLQTNADTVACEMPFGVIERTTRPQTDAERAKWEIPALQWADLSDRPSNYGVSLLNDCKYGYDATPNQIRLTLLKAPLWPDPTADRGCHQFRYALYPHAGNWAIAHTIHQGYAFNQPLRVWIGNSASSTNASLPPVGSFFTDQSQSLILSALKQSEDNPDQWILRCYESQGQTGQAIAWESLGLLNEYFDPATLESTTILEALKDDDPKRTIAPWKIATFRLTERSPEP